MKRALITGGTRGLGEAMARELLKSGHRVTVTGTRPDGKPPRGCDYVACDFARPEQVGALAARIPSMQLSALINNAGINKVGPLESQALADFSLIQQVNVAAPFRLCAAAVPGMRKRRYGRIVNITSVYGVVSKPGRSAYSTSKFGLFGLSRALALETAADGVLVNCLAPGFVDTDLTRRILGPQGMKQAAASVPLGRLARPDEIARFAAFLAGPDNTYATGQNFVVDGGYTSA